MDIYITGTDGNLHKVVTMKEAAKILNVNYHTLRTLFSRGKLDFRRIELKDQKYIYLEDIIKRSELK